MLMSCAVDETARKAKGKVIAVEAFAHALSTHQCAGPLRVIRKDTHNFTNDKRWIVDQATL